MPIVKNAATSLSQGVSQQAESQRFPSQATEQINAYSSHIRGLVKRPPTKHISTIGVDPTVTGTTPNCTKTFLHTINRDADEQYVAIVNQQDTVAISAVQPTDVTASPAVIGKVTAAESITSGTAIRFSVDETGGALPSGITPDTTYYWKTTGTQSSLSKTSGGADIVIGKVSISKIAIEAVRHTDGRWVDGVYAVTFAAGHGFIDGDTVRINGLTGDAALVLNADKDYILRRPFVLDSEGDPTATVQQDMAQTDVNGDATPLGANKFLLGEVGGEATSFENKLGYAVDDRWVADLDDDGWNAFGISVHWVCYNGATAVTDLTGNNVFNRIRYNGADSDEFAAGQPLAAWAAALTDIQAGDLLRLGSIRNLDKALRVRVASVTGPTVDHDAGNSDDSYDIVFEDYIKLDDLVDSADGVSIPWVYMAYWGDTTTDAPLASNPRQLLSTETSSAYVGTDTSWGAFKLHKGGGDTGLSVYDVKTGVQQTVNVESGLEYLTDVTNPASDLTAVTVADYTFFVNKTKVTEASSDIKFSKNYEAFITARTADYGKQYKVLVGGEVNAGKAATAAYSYVDFNGVDAAGTTVPVARLQAKKQSSQWNGYQIRLLQNWTQYKGIRDLLPPVEHRLNEYIGVEYLKASRTINIWVNFSWASYNRKGVYYEATTVTGKRTSVAKAIQAIAQSPLGADFELVALNSAGTVAGDGAALFFHTVYLGAEGVTKSVDTVSSHGNRGTLEWVEGIDETIGTGTPADRNRYVRMITIGYLSPSVGTNIVRNVYTGKGGAADTGTRLDPNTASQRFMQNGEYFYKTPRWTGDVNQEAIGTERIAEMLASSARIYDVYVADDPDTGGFTTSGAKADGTPLTKLLKGTVATKALESCFGMTYSTAAHPGKYLSKINNTGILDADITGSGENWSVVQQGYTIALKNPLGTKFAIRVDDDLGGAGLKLTYFEVDESADLPDTCRHGHVVKVVGNAREEADDYYLRFEGDGENPNELSQGRWVECVGYEQTYKFNAATMPVALVRESDGTFLLKELTWSERAAGDDKSNPYPSFIGNTINDVFLFRNRLGFLSGENVILSEAGEYFNFFKTTTAALLDSATIDVTASTNKVSTLRSALPYNEKLLVFSDQTQFILDAEPYMSPKTVSITPATEFTSFPNVKPIINGKSAFYGFARTDFSGVGEFFVSRDDADLMDGTDVTSHCPKYIKGNIKKFASATSEDVVCCITDDTTSATLYVYKFFTNDQNQKVQSAWFKYVLGTTDDYITDIDFIGNKLYLIVRRNSLMYLESLTFEDSQKDTGLDYETLLDRKLPKSSLTGVTSTTVVLPYNVTTNTKLITAGSVYKGSTTTGTTTFTVSGIDLTATDFYVGELYEMLYTFSQPFLKSQKATETGRYQIQRAFLEYANARTFDVDVVHNPNMGSPNKVTVTNTFATSSIQQGLIEGTADLQSGFYKVGIQEKNDKLQLTIKNNVPYPSDFLSIDYEARAYSRGSRWRG